MALTLESEQRLNAVGLVGLYETHKDVWLAAAQQTKAFVKKGFPKGALIRRDDVAKAFHPILEVHVTLKEHLEKRKLRGKFWMKDFGDLIIDRTWEQLDKES